MRWDPGHEHWALDEALACVRTGDPLAVPPYTQHRLRRRGRELRHLDRV